MSSLHLFLIIWYWFSHMQCMAAYPLVAAAGNGQIEHGQPFFYGACTDAVSYAKQVGGLWLVLA